MKGKKVGVITFHDYDNYGAILQSCALQKKLRELGCSPEILDYSCPYIQNPFRLVNLKKKGLFNYIYGAIGHICYLPRRKKCRRFRKHMRYSAPISAGDLQTLSKNYDALIAGSDQVWDYSLTNFDKTYFLDFPAGGAKKYSYAASIGEHLPPQEYRAEYTRLLKDFDRITVREQYGADIVEELTGTRPDIVCDPTLLLTAKEWEPYIKKPRLKKKYILVYQLGIDPQVVAFTRKLQKKTGLPVVYIPFPLVGLLKCRCAFALGPAEWMGLFQNAEYVISDSFHGAVFALLFERKFFVKSNGHHKNRRVEELLRLVGLSERTTDMPDARLTEEIDYTDASEKLAGFRRASLKKLKELIDAV